jgi:hypothetical protein
MLLTQKRLALAPILAAALISLLLLLQPAAAEAKACGAVIISPGHGWIVGGDGVSCGFMRKWSRSMLKGNGQPPGWNCRKTGRGYSRSGGCSKGPNGTTPFFIYYPPD